MLSGGEFVERLKERAPEARLSYRFPITHISIPSPRFSGDPETDEETLARMLDLAIAELRSISARLFIRFNCLTPDETEPSRPERGHTWSRLLWNVDFDPTPERDALEPSVQPKVVHFYGYKGGQARSTVLGFLGKTLAYDGWRVLAVDVDAEAPTLDVLLDVKAPDPSGTLVGLRADGAVTPFRAVTPPSTRGCLDLLAFRPRDERYDLDAAALAMEMALSPPFSEGLIREVGALRDDYDIIFVDHRTGLAATVPPWIEELPGPVVIFSRMDRQWEGALPHIEALWSLHPPRPGVLVTYHSDGSEEYKYRRRVQPQANVLLDRLAGVMSAGGEADESLSGEDVVDHWIVWPHDAAFERGTLPGPHEVAAEIMERMGELKRLLGLRSPRARTPAAGLHPSGALDEGDLIVTQALRELDADNSAKWFILGRKGTGKTRLMRELAERGRGEPLIIAEKDDKPTGIPARHPALVGLWERYAQSPQDFWWALLWAALSQSTRRDALVGALDDPTPANPRDAVIKLATAMAHPRVFLIDGLETAFDRQDTHAAIGALFQVWSSLDVDSRLSSSVRMRIFLRTDLAQRGYENLEQILYDRKLTLAWDTQSILNFALSRIRARPWYRKQFPEALARLDREADRIREGQLSAAKCEDHLLEIFPERLRRQNMLTRTFLRTWFSDDPTGHFGYFPRIYDKFLEQITIDRALTDTAIVDDRISEQLVMIAHEEATADFLQQVKVELYNLVDLDESKVDRLLAAFRERVTPFAVATEVRALATMTNLDPAAIRQALEQMKTLGIFEDRPGHAGQWRAGRLFKTSLGMLYNRGRRAQ